MFRHKQKLPNDVEVSQSSVVSIRAGKILWKLGDADLKRVEDVDLVKLQGGDWKHSVFVKLIAAVLQIPAEQTKDFSLASSVGVQKLIKERNEACDRDIKSCVLDSLGKMPKWQRDRVRPSGHASRMAKLKVKERSLLVELKFSVGDVTHTMNVLRKSKAQDDLWIEYKPDLMAALLSFVVESGVVEGRPAGKRVYRKTTELPHGVYKFRCSKDQIKYRVTVPDEVIKEAATSGKRCKKSVQCSTIEEVHEVIDNPVKFAVQGVSVSLGNTAGEEPDDEGDVQSPGDEQQPDAENDANDEKQNDASQAGSDSEFAM